ncbi:MAG: phosphate regulon sensor histidine kinase PhoR [Acidobacteriota bacterium]
MLPVVLAAAVLAALVPGLAAWWLSASELRAATIERVRAELALVAGELDREAPEPERAARLRRFADRLGMQLALIGADGRVLADSHDVLTGTVLDLQAAPELDEARRLGWGAETHRSPRSGVVYLYVALRTGAGERPDYVRAAVPLEHLAGTSRRLRLALFGFALIGPALALPLAALLLRRRLAPLAVARAAVRELAAGRLDRPFAGDAGVADDDLVADLERARQRLRQRLRRIERRYRNLTLVVSRMKEGLLLVDGDRRVVLANESFRAHVRLDADPVGRRLAEVVRDPRMIEVIDAVLESGEPRRELVRHTGPEVRAWELLVYPLPGDGGGATAGAVALMFDVSRIERLERTRREFIANVSHELRTPLASIKGAAMTLADGAADDPAARERFLATILRQVDRLGELVSDLGDLSRIETGAVRLVPEPITVRPLVEEVVEQVLVRHPDADVQVQVDVPADFVVVADRGRLEQMLVNLVDNGVKFNRPGGTVTVRAAVGDDGGPVIVVEDTGIGIAEADRERVFSRFWRVEASRSRERGGTGLGLAIVKHLMALHGGRVRLESTLGRGSRFFLEFPPARRG